MARRSALDDILRLEGSTLSEWMEGQLDARPVGTTAPLFPDLRDPSALADPSDVAADLRTIDWAFTSDDTLYLSHDVHPYPAKFIPQIPGNLIARLTLRGELVLDPFGGSGTTALEAVRLGRRAVSIDANPLGSLIGRVKTGRLSDAGRRELRAIAAGLRSRLAEIPGSSDVWANEFADEVPPIPNVEKWFDPWAMAELALIRGTVRRLIDPVASDIAALALSRTVLRVSNQESETRYVAVPKNLERGMTIARFLNDLATVVERVERVTDEVQYGIVEFITADSRQLATSLCADDSVDLIVTSPPYGNANDYHLYHRFRMYWLGFDPKGFGSIEIGSHLRHQREKTGFDSYMADLTETLCGFSRVLRPGRYAALVLGDAVYAGEVFDSAAAASDAAKPLGLDTVCLLPRVIHDTKRSFKAGRRAVEEKILVLRKKPSVFRVFLDPPPYRMWPYEEELRIRESRALAGSVRRSTDESLSVTSDSPSLNGLRRLAFSSRIRTSDWDEPTWQGVLENGFERANGARKDPKYVTHGIHSYKGKFYPQLAKALLNLSGVAAGKVIFDPFCGSGTTLLEARLNGLRARGCDLNPLAAKIARAKVGVLDVPPSDLRDVVAALTSRINSAPARLPDDRDQFHADAIGEIESWFPYPVVAKLNWVLANIRSLTYGIVQDFFEVLLSDLVRDCSHQDPSDLRIRRRKTPLEDAEVFNLYLSNLNTHLARLERFWSVRGYAPYEFHSAVVCEGDSRSNSTLEALALGEESVDLVLTSPPYATALPYIDTDRLSLLLLFGATSSKRRPLEHALIGSREITVSERTRLECSLEEGSPLPREVLAFVKKLHDDVARASDAGFRRKNLPALLVRFFQDMRLTLSNLQRVVRTGGQVMAVLGDNVTQVAGETRVIPTTQFVSAIARDLGFEVDDKIAISVTRENVVHVRNAITANTVLRLHRS